MADSFSPLLNLRLQQTGGNTNTWGDLLNSDTVTPLENAIAGRAIHSVSGGTLDLSASPMIEQLHIFTGALSSDQTVTVPLLNKRMAVQNATSGGFALILSGGGNTARIPQGTIKDVYTNSGGPFRADATEAGAIMFFGNTSVPSGWLECDGSAISRVNYPELFAAIGTTWGTGNGSTTFNVPDFKTAGRFIRSRTGSAAVGTLQAADIAPHNHTASATTGVTVTITGDGAWTPTISISDPTHTHLFSPGNGGFGGNSHAQFAPSPGAGADFVTGAVATVMNFAATGITATSSGIGNHTHSGSSASATTSVTVNNSTGTETRPINASALACIRY